MVASKLPGTYTNVLSLDGGGVRGLSALIVLRKLLCMINAEVHNHDPACLNQPMKPLEVFDFVVGTSTGGLIALMIVKMGMDVNQCIDAYKILSEKIFRHRHRRTYFTQGLGRKAQYSSAILRESILANVMNINLNGRQQEPEMYGMKDVDTHANHHCSVVCRELDPDTDEWKPYSVFLCSHTCVDKQRHYGNVPVIEAALATSAAPTYFDKQWVANHLLADGGFGQTNNPSFAIWEHHYSINFNLNQDKMHFINIGTGAAKAQPDEGLGDLSDATDARKTRYENRQKKWIQFIRRPWSVLKNLQAIATDATTPAHQMETVMRTCARGDSRPLEFHRLSVDDGTLHVIDLAAYQKLQQIEDITNDYFKTGSEGHKELSAVAKQLAEVYRMRHPPSPTQQAAQTLQRPTISTTLPDPGVHQISHLTPSSIPSVHVDTLLVPPSAYSISGSSVDLSPLSETGIDSRIPSPSTSVSSRPSTAPSLTDVDAALKHALSSRLDQVESSEDQGSR